MIAFILAAALAVQPLPAPGAPGASTVPTTTAPEPAATTIRPASTIPPAPEQVLAVPDELREMMRREGITSAAISPKQRLDRLMALMFEPNKLGMEYRPDATYTVAEAFRARQANCLTFSLMTIALVREAGMHAHAQEIDRTLSWNALADGMVMQNTHVNAGVIADGRQYTIDVAFRDLLTTTPPKRISDARLLAMYYNNRAMEVMAAGGHAEAEAWLRNAFRLDDSHPMFWNNAGVLALRKGERAQAERDFLHALELNDGFAGALFNLVGFYQASGDAARAAQWRQRAEKTLRKDPFHQFVQGQMAEKRGDYAQALDFYQRAVRLYDGEASFHAALARVWLHAGDARRAGQALARARDLDTTQNRARYQAKLDKLSELRSRNPSASQERLDAAERVRRLMH